MREPIDATTHRAVLDERDRLRAEVAALTHQNTHMIEACAATGERAERAEAEIAALEKDAERWRAVHELDGDQMDAFVAAHWINPEALNATIDAAIDAARAALKG